MFYMHCKNTRNMEMWKERSKNYSYAAYIYVAAKASSFCFPRTVQVVCNLSFRVRDAVVD